MAELKTIKLNALTRKGKPSKGESPVFPHSVFSEGEKTQAWNKIPSSKKLGAYESLNWKPGKAVSSSQNLSATSLLVFYVREDAKNVPKYILGQFVGKDFSKPANWLWNLEEDSIGGTNPYSHSMYYMLMAKKFAEGDANFLKIWFNLSFDSKSDPHHSLVYLEENQRKEFGDVVSALTYFCFEELSDVLWYNQSAFDDDLNSMMTINNFSKVVDYTSWINKEFEESDEYPFLRTIGGVDVEISQLPRPSFEKKKKPKKTSSKDFWKQDFQMMTDKEAGSLPAFLQLSRKECRELFESNKETLNSRQKRLIQMIHGGDARNISFSGPAGSGKTTVAKIIAGALNLPLRLVTGKAGVDSSVYLGYESIQSQNGTSVTKWHDGPITEAVRYGALLLFDEVNLTSPEVIGTLNTLLDDTRALVLDNGEVVKADPRFTYIEAMNRGAGYCGTEETNLSHDNRMLQVRFAEMSIDKEIDILAKNTGYDNKSLIKKLCRIERFCKEHIEDNSSQLVSIRDIERWIVDAKYTQDWLESGIDTVITSLVAKDEEYDEINPETIAQQGGLAHLVYEQMKLELEDEEY